nr:glycosyltransferase family 9 protein [uncultured Desulfuromonas sp.]
MCPKNSAGGLERVLPISKSFAARYGADLAIPNCQGSGVGNALVYTRLVEEWARHLGRPVKIITAPLAPSVGCVVNEDPFAIWRNNPFVWKILDGEEIDPAGFRLVDQERKTLIQVNHIIENICFAYGLKPRRLQPSIFLTQNEIQWALNETRELKRPLVCLHPGGTSGSKPGAPWHHTYWHHLIEKFNRIAGFFQIGRPEFGDQDLELAHPGKTLRELMALISISDVFIGFDSSPMNIATGLEKPVIALFDMKQKYDCESRYDELNIPSVMLRWAYPQNHNFGLMPNDNGDAALAFVCHALKTELASLTYNI